MRKVEGLGFVSTLLRVLVEGFGVVVGDASWRKVLRWYAFVRVAYYQCAE